MTILLQPLPPVTPEVIMQAASTLDSLKRFNTAARLGINPFSSLLHLKGWEEERHSIGDCIQLHHSECKFVILVGLSRRGRRENVERMNTWQNLTPELRTQTFDILDMLPGGTALAMRAPNYSNLTHTEDSLWPELRAKLECNHVGTLLTDYGPCYGRLL